MARPLARRTVPRPAPEACLVGVLCYGLDMSGAAVTCAVGAMLALWAGPWGMYIGLGLAILATGLGWVAYRRRQTPGASRLVGAGAMAAGIVALLIAVAKVSLTLMAIDAMERLL